MAQVEPRSETPPADQPGRWPLRLVLLSAAVLFAALWALYPQEFVASDPWAYSSRAYAILTGPDFGPNHPFSHRLAVTLPTALFYGLFGVNIWTTDLWPLCASLLILAVVWTALPTAWSKVLGALLCVTSVALIHASTELLPDVVAGALMAASALLLFRRRRLAEGRFAWAFAGLPVLLAFLAFEAKESAYWLLPLWLAAAWSDSRGREWPLLLRRFYVPAILTGAVLGGAYLAFCAFVWGSAFARLAAIQSLTGQHLWAWDHASRWELVKRLTIAPVELLTMQYGMAVLALAALGFVLAPASLQPWCWYTAACLLFYWFGSTSLTRYEPMPLSERMTLPVLPGLYILAAYGASRLSIAGMATARHGRLLAASLVTLLLLGPLAGELLSWRQHERAEAQAMAIVTSAVQDEPGTQMLLVCSDERSVQALAFYFGYRLPPNLRAATVDELLRTPALAAAERAFVFVNHPRSLFLAEAFGLTSHDEEIAAAAGAAAFDLDGVSLRVTSDVAELRDKLRTLQLLNRGTVGSFSNPPVQRFNP